MKTTALSIFIIISIVVIFDTLSGQRITPYDIRITDENTIGDRPWVDVLPSGDFIVVWADDASRVLYSIFHPMVMTLLILLKLQQWM
jgi:hypothetical protein